MAQARFCSIAIAATGAAFAQSDFWADLEGALPTDSFGMELAWDRELGSGYSRISIANGKAVTMFASGDVDVVAAFDVTNGNELWRYELGEKYAGHTGSDDGPIGTPTLHDGTVYALGPRGQLVALSLADGRERWRRELDEATSSVDPGTEAVVEVAMEALMEGRTVIAIAHRLSTSERCDRVALFADGRLAELGSHRDLVASGGRYAELFDAWTAGLAR